MVLNAVLEQNRKGPIAGVDNAKWKVIRRSDPVVTAFQSGPAGVFLKAKLAESSGAVSEAFLNAAMGEKVAFVEKTTSYLHRGSAKFDAPFASGKAWQGPAEFDESSQTYAIQIVGAGARGREAGRGARGRREPHVPREGRQEVAPAADRGKRQER